MVPTVVPTTHELGASAAARLQGSEMPTFNTIELRAPHAPELRSSNTPELRTSNTPELQSSNMAELRTSTTPQLSPQTTPETLTWHVPELQASRNPELPATSLPIYELATQDLTSIARHTTVISDVAMREAANRAFIAMLLASYQTYEGAGGIPVQDVD